MGAFRYSRVQLTDLYNSFTELHDKDKLKLARSLVNQEGEIDLEVEGLVSAENQRDMSLKFAWGHDHTFNDDFKVKGRMGNRHINVMTQFHTTYNFSKDYFNGKDVIDIGCWTGGTTLLLKALGANKVLALEEVQKYARTARILVSDIYEQERVTCKGTSVYDLDSIEEYDIAYFPGVLYHLSDPIVALRRLFNALKDGGEIYIESAGLRNPDRAVCAYIGNERGEPDRDIAQRFGWTYYIPSLRCLEKWLIEAGFCNIKCTYIESVNRLYGYGKREKHVEITKAGFSRPDIP